MLAANRVHGIPIIIAQIEQNRSGKNAHSRSRFTYLIKLGSCLGHAGSSVNPGRCPGTKNDPTRLQRPQKEKARDVANEAAAGRPFIALLRRTVPLMIPVKQLFVSILSR